MNCDLTCTHQGTCSTHRLCCTEAAVEHYVHDHGGNVDCCNASVTVIRHRDRSLIPISRQNLLSLSTSVSGACDSTEAAIAWILVQGLRGLFWSLAGENASRMDWTVAATANLVVDGVPRLREHAAPLTDLACRALLALTESVTLPEGATPLLSQQHTCLDAQVQHLCWCLPAFGTSHVLPVHRTLAIYGTAPLQLPLLPQHVFAGGAGRVVVAVHLDPLMLLQQRHS